MICVMKKIGTTLTSRASSEASGVYKEQSTICPFVSGVARRMSYVWLSFSCVI